MSGAKDNTEANAIKLTPKQERFAQAYIELGDASAAYRQAYNAADMKPETVNKRASEMLAKRAIAGRINDLRGKHAERHEITVDGLVGELEEARELARAQGAAAAMVNATMGKAKLCGLLIDKSEIGGKDGGPIQLGIVDILGALDGSRRTAPISE